MLQILAPSSSHAVLRSARQTTNKTPRRRRLCRARNFRLRRMPLVQSRPGPIAILVTSPCDAPPQRDLCLCLMTPNDQLRGRPDHACLPCLGRPNMGSCVSAHQPRSPEIYKIARVNGHRQMHIRGKLTRLSAQDPSCGLGHLTSSLTASGPLGFNVVVGID